MLCCSFCLPAVSSQGTFVPSSSHVRMFSVLRKHKKSKKISVSGSSMVSNSNQLRLKAGVHLHLQLLGQQPACLSCVDTLLLDSIRLGLGLEMKANTFGRETSKKYFDLRWNDCSM